jgi:hypothetical protein
MYKEFGLSIHFFYTVYGSSLHFIYNNKHLLKFMKRNKLGFTLLMFSLFVVGVSAYVYQEATLNITQTIIEVATFTVQNSALGNIYEGETKSYTETEVGSLGDAVSIVITEQPVYLYFDSDVQLLSSAYSTYTITVKFSQVQGSTYSVGDTAATISLASPDPSAVTLDATGEWKFDFEVSTTAESVDVDTGTTATIVVQAQSS